MKYAHKRALKKIPTRWHYMKISSQSSVEKIGLDS